MRLNSRGPSTIVSALVATTIGCAAKDGFVCSDDASCGADGRCEPTSYCSFPDDDCASGRRYGEHAAKSLAKQCVEPDVASDTTQGTSSASSSSMTTMVTTIDEPGSSSTGDTSSSTGGGPTTLPVTATDTSGPGPVTDDAGSSTTGESTAITIGPIIIADDLDDGAMWPAVGNEVGAWSPSGEMTPGLAYLGEYPEGSTYYGYFRFAIPDALPAGTVVTGATFQLMGAGVYMWNDDVDALEIRAQLADDAPQVVGLADYPDAMTTPLTDVAVRWPEDGGLAWNGMDLNTSPDLAVLLQAVIDDRGGLAAGAHVQLWIGAAELGLGGREVAWLDASAREGELARLTLDVVVP